MTISANRVLTARGARRSGRAAPAAALAVLLAVGAAGGPRQARAATVGTDPGGVTVTVSRLTRLLGGPPPRAAAGGCGHRLVPVVDTMVPPGPLEGPAPSAEHRLYLVFCDGEYLRPVWLRPVDLAGADPLELLEEAVRRLPLAPAAVRARPARGLTGLPTVFTVEGLDPVTHRTVVEELGTRVEVEAVPGDARWDFGDGTTWGPLAAAAAVSTAHGYERASTPGAHRVSVAFEWTVRYRVDGGGWLAAPPVARAGGLDHPVTEARARLVPGSRS